MDAVQKVGNGHPGTAMSLAPAAYLLYQRILRHDPADPQWPGRDRFVLSCGHSSLTLYIQLYLSGYALSLDDLKALRTWGSITPGHPEYHVTPGVEITTGGSCSIPTEVEIDATTMSITRKGKNKTVPIWNPILSSESMYAGATTLSDRSFGLRGRPSLDNSTNSATSFSRT